MEGLPNDVVTETDELLFNGFGGNNWSTEACVGGTVITGTFREKLIWEILRKFIVPSCSGETVEGPPLLPKCGNKLFLFECSLATCSKNRTLK